MVIKNNPEHDPAGDLKIVDAYMRWALLAAEEVVGKKGMSVVLREAKLERVIDNLPPNELKASGGYSFGEYASLNAALLNFFGRAAKSMVLRIGRLSAKQGIEQQGAMFGIAALIASKVLPFPAQVKLGLEAMRDGFVKVYGASGQKVEIVVEDRGDRIAYLDYGCANCAGKQSDAPMCWIHLGVIQEGLRWQTGKEAEVLQAECRAMGAAACVWEVSKKAKE
ncbi:MAG: 4-vinyl reductase [Chloroflexi bacterium]|nr:4-vinyl reductase [Chloroflexota bacterium]